MKILRKLSLLALCALVSQAVQCTPTKTDEELKALELQVKALELQEKYDCLKAKKDLQECLRNNRGIIVVSSQGNHHPQECDKFVRTFAILAGYDEVTKIINGYRSY